MTERDLLTEKNHFDSLFNHINFDWAEINEAIIAYNTSSPNSIKRDVAEIEIDELTEKMLKRLVDLGCHDQVVDETMKNDHFHELSSLYIDAQKRIGIRMAFGLMNEDKSVAVKIIRLKELFRQYCFALYILKESQIAYTFGNNLVKFSNSEIFNGLKEQVKKDVENHLREIKFPL